MKQDKNANIFPKDFLWGASTSSHQVEGGTYNQWTVWELEHAKDLAKNAEERYTAPEHHYLTKLPAWKEFKKAAEDPENYVSGKGVDHYRLYEHDFDILQKLNLNAFRFSIEWSRIEPAEGEWDIDAIEHYRQYIKALRKRNIEPMLNIWHWAAPVWFTDKGGFKHSRNLKYFDRLVQKISDEFGADLRYVITLNEPNVYTSFSYFLGQWPPQETKLWGFVHVYWNLVKAHRRAYRILKNDHPHLQVGIAAQLANIAAKRPRNLFDVAATESMRYFWNWWFIGRMRKEQDFVGMNYYFTDYYQLDGHGMRVKDPNVPRSDLGWYMEPEGLYPLLVRAWEHYKKPIIITETGLADEHDDYRQWWINENIVAMERALSEGVDIRGYFHWSLLDNFEWAYGWWPKFGLVAVDRKKGMKRSVRPSAKWFAERIKQISED